MTGRKSLAFIGGMLVCLAAVVLLVEKPMLLLGFLVAGGVATA